MFNIYANKYAPIDPLVPPCEINLVPIGYVGEDKTRCLVFDLTDCIQKLGAGTWQISFVRPGDNATYICTNTEQLDDNAIWVITDTDTAYEGYGLVQLMYFPSDGGNAKSAQYRTVTYASNGETGDAPDPYEGLLEQIAQLTSQATAAASTATAAAQTAASAVEEGITIERSQRVAADTALETELNALKGAVGAPLTTSTASGMTDTSKVYVYTGSETGYVYGNWYYYNGAEWVSGGAYQASAVQTDPTLSVEGMAADAAATGDLKSQIYSAFVTESITDSAIASFDDGADDVPVKDLVVNITPKQAGSGDPSPTNVRAISGWTEANITRAAKNLLSRSLAEIKTNNNTGTWSGNSYTQNGVTFTILADSLGHVTQIMVNGTATTSTWLRVGSIDDLSNGTYIFSGTPPTGSSSTYYLALTDTTSFTTETGTGATIIKSASLTGNIAINIRPNYTASNLIFTPMIRLASDTDATFEPYNGTTYQISFGSAGTVYGGTLDVTSGMLTVTHSGFSLRAGTNWKKSVSYPGGYYFEIVRIASEYNVPVPASYTPFDCSHAKIVLSTSGYVYGTCYCDTSFNFRIMSESSTLQDWNDYLEAQYANGTPVQVRYALSNPISYQLTPTEVKTLLANNNIWSDTGSVASLEYRADTGILINKLTNAIVSLGGNI